MKQLKSKLWWEAVFVRMIRTFAEAFLSTGATNLFKLTVIDVKGMLGVSATAAILALLLALKSLPEVDPNDVVGDD